MKKNINNKIKLKLIYQTSYKPLNDLRRGKQKKNISKKIYYKNYIYLYLILQFFKNILSNLSFKFYFFKKKNYFRNILRAPNRHKKAQTKLAFVYYYGILTLTFDTFNFNSNFNFNLYFIYFNFLNQFFNFFESNLLILQKKQIILPIMYEL